MVATPYVNMCKQTYKKINTPKIDTHICILNYLYLTFFFSCHAFFFPEKKMLDRNNSTRTYVYTM